jgi:hypothetical protein
MNDFNFQFLNLKFHVKINVLGNQSLKEVYGEGEYIKICWSLPNKRLHFNIQESRWGYKEI